MLPTITSPVTGANNVASTSRMLCQVMPIMLFATFIVPPRTETATPRPSLTRNPTLGAKIFAKILARAYKLDLVGWYDLFSLFSLGVVVFCRFALVHTRVRYTGYKVLVWLRSLGEKISSPTRSPLHTVGN